MTEAYIRLLQSRYATLKDPEMQELIASGRGIDVSIFPKTKRGSYVLPVYLPDKVYIDCFWQAWVRSIGTVKNRTIEEMTDGTWRILPTGTLLASWEKIYDDRLNILFP